jgi:hypothetical protein
MHAQAVGGYPAYPLFQGNGLSGFGSGRRSGGQGGGRHRNGQGNGRRQGVNITVNSGSGAYRGHGDKGHSHKHRHVDPKTFAADNGLEWAPGKKLGDLFDEAIRSGNPIVLKTEAVFIAILPRLIIHYGWPSAKDLVIATEIMKLAQKGNIVAPFVATPDSMKLLELVQHARKSAKFHLRRTSGESGGAAAKHGETASELPKTVHTGSQLTSMRH